MLQNWVRFFKSPFARYLTAGHYLVTAYTRGQYTIIIMIYQGRVAIFQRAAAYPCAGGLGCGGAGGFWGGDAGGLGCAGGLGGM